mmetsp:Transcript_11302/g.30533  ORF Transcript_11302/g.30533 Transcript_11302/m.30533 type:complete len:202 (-) Transcript_11302:1102-1707(-)
MLLACLWMTRARSGAAIASRAASKGRQRRDVCAKRAPCERGTEVHAHARLPIQDGKGSPQRFGAGGCRAYTHGLEHSHMPVRVHRTRRLEQDVIGRGRDGKRPVPLAVCQGGVQGYTKGDAGTILGDVQARGGLGRALKVAKAAAVARGLGRCCDSSGDARGRAGLPLGNRTSTCAVRVAGGIAKRTWRGSRRWWCARMFP